MTGGSELLWMIAPGRLADTISYTLMPSFRIFLPANTQSPAIAKIGVRGHPDKPHPAGENDKEISSLIFRLLFALVSPLASSFSCGNR